MKIQENKSESEISSVFIPIKKRKSEKNQLVDIVFYFSLYIYKRYPFVFFLSSKSKISFNDSGRSF